jgi:DNA-binding MarR family transcriptional regulator
VHLRVQAQPTIGELAELLEVTQQAASKSVVELETLGYVRREADPTDSRRRRIVLTDQGRDAVATSRRFRSELERALIDELGERNVDDTRRVLVALLRHLGATDAVAARRVPLPRE